MSHKEEILQALDFLSNNINEIWTEDRGEPPCEECLSRSRSFIESLPNGAIFPTSVTPQELEIVFTWHLEDRRLIVIMDADFVHMSNRYYNGVPTFLSDLDYTPEEGIPHHILFYIPISR